MGKHDKLLTRLRCGGANINMIEAAEAIEELRAENEALRSGALCAAPKPPFWHRAKRRGSPCAQRDALRAALREILALSGGPIRAIAEAALEEAEHG